MSQKAIKEIQEEANAFDQLIMERIQNGFVPDLQKLQPVKWFYNNMWREPEFVAIHWMPKVNFVLDIIQKNPGPVLEIGCGSGYLALEIARCGEKVTGIDISRKSIEIADAYARKEGFSSESLCYRCESFEEAVFEDETFMSVVFFRSLHHLVDIDAILKKVRKILKIGGHFIACEPMRDKFSRKSAEFAAILRALMPTWVSFEEKLGTLQSVGDFDSYLNDIFNEYTYVEDHSQSPNDNSINSGEMLDSIWKNFDVKTVEYTDAVIDKLIGGLRGEYRFLFARFLKLLDKYMVEKKILAPTSLQIHGVKTALVKEEGQ